MKIQVDTKETAALLQYCMDIVLKATGLQNLQAVTQILQSITIEEKEVKNG